MVQVGTLLKVCDKSGINLVRCIKVLGPSKKKIAKIGDIILVSIRQKNPKKFKGMKEHKKRRFRKGFIHRALVVRTKVNYERSHNVVIKFNENSVVLVNKRVVPITNRVYGPILTELCRK
jgi:large subunit ribosomal protein L14